MIKKLIVVAVLIATLGIGMVAQAQATGGSTDRQAGTGRKGRHRTHYGRHHRRHRHGGNMQGRRGPKKN